MGDRENVITHLQIIRTWASFARERDLQFFTAKHLEDIAQWADDALKLLKEQEAVKPIRDANCVRMFRCGACGEYVGFIDSDPGDPNEQDNYCRNCGRAVVWNA